MDTIIVRPAQVDDAPQILAVQHRAFRPVGEQYGDADLPPFRQTLDELHATFDTHVILVACNGSGGEITGAVRALVRDGTAFIGRLVVEPELQGRGTGRRLLAAIEAAVAPVQRYELFTGHRSERSIALYEEMGYRRVRTVPATEKLSLTYLTKAARSDDTLAAQ